MDEVIWPPLCFSIELVSMRRAENVTHKSSPGPQQEVRRTVLPLQRLSPSGGLRGVPPPATHLQQISAPAERGGDESVTVFRLIGGLKRGRRLLCAT